MATILLIDDDMHVQASLGELLREAGYQVISVSGVDQADLALAGQAVDLALLEVATQHGEGWNYLRMLAHGRGVPVIVVSRHGREEDIVAAFDLGASDVVTKPFHSGELLARVRARLRDHGQAASAAVVAPAHPATPSSPPAAAAERFSAADGDAQDTPVFIDPADEQALLRERDAAEEPPADLDSLPLSDRLRAARRRLKLSLVQAELETKLRMWYLQAMEEARFGLLPRGAQAEEMVRRYAAYLGLDPERAVTDFRTEYGEQPPQPIAYLGGRPEPREIPQWLIVTTAALLALAIGVGAIWFFAAEQAAALGANLRALVSPPTATPTPTATPFPTLTPTPQPTATATPTPRPTTTPTPRPTATPLPSALPGTPAPSTPTP